MELRIYQSITSHDTIMKALTVQGLQDDEVFDLVVYEHVCIIKG